MQVDHLEQWLHFALWLSFLFCLFFLPVETGACRPLIKNKNKKTSLLICVDKLTAPCDRGTAPSRDFIIIIFSFLNLRWMQVESKRNIQQSRCVEGPEPDPNPTCFDLPVICLGILTPTPHSKLQEIRWIFV